MYLGISELYANRAFYCRMVVRLSQLKWWEFKKKKLLRAVIDATFPIMMSEVIMDENSRILNKK